MGLLVGGSRGIHLHHAQLPTFAHLPHRVLGATVLCGAKLRSISAPKTLPESIDMFTSGMTKLLALTALSLMLLSNSQVASAKVLQWQLENVQLFANLVSSRTDAG